LDLVFGPVKDLPTVLWPLLAFLIGEEWGDCLRDTRVGLFQRSNFSKSADREAATAARDGQISREVAFGVWGHNHI
jgi:hypothetical protein